jgi:hypothetical protein
LCVDTRQHFLGKADADSPHIFAVFEGQCPVTVKLDFVKPIALGKLLNEAPSLVL